MPKKVNKGNIVTGGVQYVGNQAIGGHAQANWNTSREDVTALLTRIETLLAESRLPEHAAAKAELDDLKQELAAEHPRQSVVKRALEGLAMFAKPVTPLVSAVAQLAEAVHGG
jgi:hypothetical protein